MALGLAVPEPITTCSDKNCPFHGSLSIRGQTIEGTVASTDMEKTVIVEREYDVAVPKYDRYMKRRSRIPAHAPPCIQLEVGDKVKIGETRRLSKTKSHVVVERLQRDTSSDDEITSVEEDGQYLVYLNDEELCKIKNFDGFYGVYWTSSDDIQHSFASVVDLVRQVHPESTPETSDSPSNPFVSGVVIQDYSREVRLSPADLAEVFETFESADGRALSTVLSGIAEDIDTDDPVTFFRVNTSTLNVSVETDGNNNQFGILTDRPMNVLVSEFVVQTSGLRESVHPESDLLERLTTEINEFVDGAR